MINSRRGAVTLGVLAMSVLIAVSFVYVVSAQASLQKSFNQCANKNPTLGECDWIGSIVQQSNSQYFENDELEQRVVFNNIATTSGNTHTLTFAHEFTKAGVHAYDFLTGYDQPPHPLTNLNPCADLASMTSICNNLRAGSNSILVDAPDDSYVSHDGLTQSRINAYENIYGNRQIKIYGNSPITSATLTIVSHSVANGADTGDSETNYQLTWVSASTQVLIEMAGHIAMGDDFSAPGVGWGIGNGASSISGGPYHINLDKLDGSAIGSQDNQIKGSEILLPEPPPMGTLTVIKNVINDNGGTLTSENFNIQVTGTNVSLSAFNGSSEGTIVELDEGAFSVTETPVTGYSGTLSADCSGVILSGESKICTITNDDIQPRLTLIKHVVNDNGGNAVVGDFPLSVGETIVVSGVENGFNAGQYIASEATNEGYTASSWSGDCAENGAITLSIGDNETCEITNDDVAPTIQLIKIVQNDNGGNAGVDDFGLTIGGTGVTSGQILNVNANTPIALNEAGLEGYEFVSITGEGCPQSLNGEVSLNEGQNLVCTITNQDIPAQITLTKVVVNDNGGTAGENDFGISIDGNPIISGTTISVDSNTPHAIDEDGLTGYEFTGISGDEECPEVLGGSVTLNEGQSISCTITNNDIAPQLTLVKTVINNNGGTKTVADFPLSINEGQNGFFVASGSITALSANVLYTASEDSDSGYEASSWGGDCAADGSITLQPGDVKVCTITNDDIPGTLVVVKHVINDNGGDNDAEDFTMNVDAANPSQPSFAGSEIGIEVSVDAGEYSVDESDFAGYSKNLGNDCSGTIANGETKTCTITNDDRPAAIILIKNVINNNGGTAGENDFGLNVDAQIVNSGSSTNVDSNTLHTIGESELNGYEFVSITGEGCPQSLNGEVILNEGVTLTCTITNDDIQPRLTVIKEVINDNGGILEVGSFPLFVSGNPVSSGVENGLGAGTYTVSETENLGYEGTFSGDCDSQGQVSLSIGDVKTCTITNDDLPATLIVIKHVVNNNTGVALASDFTMQVSAVNPSQTSFAGNEDGVSVTVDAGQYSVDEISSIDYDKTLSADCTGTIANGETKTCTIINDDLFVEPPREYATRTIGFWQTHTSLTTGVFNNNFSGGMTIGIAPHKGSILNVGQLFGAFYSSISKMTSGVKRTSLDQARMIMLQQLVAAKLNCAAFGCSEETQDLISDADTAFASGSASEILALASQLDAYNNGGDALPISLSSAATPKNSQNQANKVFWDAP